MIDGTHRGHSDLSHKLIQFFEKHQAFSLPEDSILIASHQQPDFIFFLREGVVKQTSISPKGQELCLNLYKPGSFFPLMWTLTDIPNTYAFTSVLPISGWKAPVAEVEAFIHENPDVSYDLNVRLLKGLHGMLIRTEKLMEGNARALLIQTLFTLAERFPVPDHHSLTITIPLTHQKLADLTGLSRETVTRELSALKKKHLVSSDTHLTTILSVTGLRELLGV